MEYQVDSMECHADLWNMEYQKTLMTYNKRHGIQRSTYGTSKRFYGIPGSNYGTPRGTSGITRSNFGIPKSF